MTGALEMAINKGQGSQRQQDPKEEDALKRHQSVGLGAGTKDGTTSSCLGGVERSPLERRWVVQALR